MGVGSRNSNGKVRMNKRTGGFTTEGYKVQDVKREDPNKRKATHTHTSSSSSSSLLKKRKKSISDTSHLKHVNKVWVLLVGHIEESVILSNGSVTIPELGTKSHLDGVSSNLKLSVDEEPDDLEGLEQRRSNMSSMECGLVMFLKSD